MHVHIASAMKTVSASSHNFTIQLLITRTEKQGQRRSAETEKIRRHFENGNLKVNQGRIVYATKVIKPINEQSVVQANKSGKRRGPQTGGQQGEKDFRRKDFNQVSNKSIGGSMVHPKIVVENISASRTALFHIRPVVIVRIGIGYHVAPRQRCGGGWDGESDMTPVGNGKGIGSADPNRSAKSSEAKSEMDRRAGHGSERMQWQQWQRQRRSANLDRELMLLMFGFLNPKEKSYLLWIWNSEPDCWYRQVSALSRRRVTGNTATSALRKTLPPAAAAVAMTLRLDYYGRCSNAVNWSCQVQFNPVSYSIKGKGKCES
jgi:hypothetical protein